LIDLVGSVVYHSDEWRIMSSVVDLVFQHCHYVVLVAGA
jgi:hypothetical protein